VDRSWNKLPIFVSPYINIVDKGDLSRYIAGDVLLHTIRSVSVEYTDKPSHLSAIPINESEIPEIDRIPRVTSAIWYAASSYSNYLIKEIRLWCNWIVDSLDTTSRTKK
jgi:hypothetical protein